MSKVQDIIMISSSDESDDPYVPIIKKKKPTAAAPHKSAKIKLPKKIPQGPISSSSSSSSTFGGPSSTSTATAKDHANDIHEELTDEIESDEPTLVNINQDKSYDNYGFTYSPEKDHHQYNFNDDDDELPDILDEPLSQDQKPKSSSSTTYSSKTDDGGGYHDVLNKPVVFDDYNNSFDHLFDDNDDDDDDDLPDLPEMFPSSSSSTSTWTSSQSQSQQAAKNTQSKKGQSSQSQSQFQSLRPGGPGPSSSSNLYHDDDDGPNKATLSKKEEKKLESERKKEAKRLEREEKKLELERLKELKKSENELRKNQKPGESIKFMTVLMDEEIVTIKGLEKLCYGLIANDVNHELMTDPIIPNSMTFRREMVFQAMGDDLKMHKVSKFQDEDQIFIIISYEQLIPLIVSENDLIIHVKSMMSVMPEKKMTLLIFGLDSYYKKMKLSEQKDFRDRVLNNDQTRKKKKDNLPNISKLEVESALIELQLETHVNFRKVKDVNVISYLIYQYTKSIAEAPFKNEKRHSNFDWYAIGDLTGTVLVEKDGTGIKALWLEQIQLFNNTGIDLARAIVGRYPTPKILNKAYLACRTEEEGQNLLRDITAKVGVGPLAKNRKVGPELSKKMYRLFTTTRQERTLGSSNDF